MWNGLAEILESVRDNPQTAVKSGNGVGKTFTAACIVPWWLESHEEATALLTGSSWHAIKNALFPYIHTLIEDNGLFEDSGFETVNDTEIRLDPKRFAFGKAAREHAGIAGIHSANLLQIVEESSDLSELVATAISGNAVGSNDRRLYLGNPLNASGPFYKWCTDPQVNVITISALDHPNVIHDRDDVPGAVTREAVEEKLRAWSREVDKDEPNAFKLPWADKWYQLDFRSEARILGRFPSSSTDALLSRDLLEACRDREKNPRGAMALGVDVARFGGDETVFYWVAENGLLYWEAYHGLREPDIAGRIIAWYKDKEPYPISNVAVDCTGGYGGGVVDLLLEADIPHIGVVFSEASNEPERFANLKAEMYWKFKQEIEYRADFFITDDPVFIHQGSEVRHERDSKGRTKIESKEEYKKRNGDSPDRLEAAMIGMYALHYTPPSAPPSQIAADPLSAKYSDSATRVVGTRYGPTVR